MDIKKYSKAIAGVVGGALVVFLSQYTEITAEVSSAIQVILGAVVTGVIVYFSPRNEE